MVCELQYSRAAARLVGGGALATVALLALVPLPPALALALAALVAAAAAEATYRVALHRGSRGARRLRLALDGAIEVDFGDGRRTAGVLRAGSFVAPWLTVVRWRPAAGRLDRTILLLPDMADAATLRKIRLILRWG